MAYRSGFVVTHLLATAVKEPHRVHSILDSGAYDGYPMENDWREILVARQELEGDGSDKIHQGETECAYKLAKHV